MHQVVSITLIFALLVSPLSAYARGAKAKPIKPIEVLSDPYGTGQPTHYTILRGHTRVAFSHALAGQFTRVEITQMEKTNRRTTRFVLSPDGKRYRPTMYLVEPFSTHGYTVKNDNCETTTTSTAVGAVGALAPAVKDGELVAKKRKELTDSKFFGPSCFVPEWNEESKNALMNAAADVFAIESQRRESPPKYLNCLEVYGLAKESGEIQALAKQTIEDGKTVPRLNIACDVKTLRKPGKYDEHSRTLTIKKTPEPVRDDYGAVIFHEVLHAIPIKDGHMLDTIEQCCTLGTMCDVVKEYAKTRQSGEKRSAIAEVLDSRASVASGMIAAYKGSDNELLNIGAKSHALQAAESQSIAPTTTSFFCSNVGAEVCKSEGTIASAFMSKVMNECRPVAATTNMNSLGLSYIAAVNLIIAESAYAATNNCGTGSYATVYPELKKEIGTRESQTVAQLAESLPMTGPITWDVPPAPAPATPTQPIALPMQAWQQQSDEEPAFGSFSETIQAAPPRPSRGIASISPLPTSVATRKLGDSSGRRDVTNGGRATVLVDTLERAARKVSSTLTIETLDTRNIGIAAALRPPKETRASVEQPQFIVAGLGNQPLKVANISDIKDVGFPNPFADAKSKPNDSRISTLADSDGAGIPISKGGSRDDSRDVGSGTSTTGIGLPGAATAQLTQSGSMNPFAATGDGRNPTATGKTKTLSFDTMTPNELKRFVTGSYRAVTDVLEDQKFLDAITKSGIQIFDHENRKLGAMEPMVVDGVKSLTVFVYNSEKSRLIQSRTHSDSSPRGRGDQ